MCRSIVRGTPCVSGDLIQSDRCVIQGGHLEVVDILITAKANVNAGPARFYGRTAIQAVAEGAHLEVVERLINVKADVNAQPTGSTGCTALQAAAGGGYTEIGKVLEGARGGKAC